MNKLDRTSVNLFRSSPFVVNYYVYVCNNPYAKRMIKVTKLHFFSLVFRSIFPRKSSTVSSTVSRRIKSSFLFFFSPHFDYYLVSLPFPLHLSSSYSHEKRTLFVIFSYFFFSFSFFFKPPPVSTSTYKTVVDTIVTLGRLLIWERIYLGRCVR